MVEQTFVVFASSCDLGKGFTRYMIEFDGGDVKALIDLPIAGGEVDLFFDEPAARRALDAFIDDLEGELTEPSGRLQPFDGDPVWPSLFWICFPYRGGYAEIGLSGLSSSESGAPESGAVRRALHDLIGPARRAVLAPGGIARRWSSSARQTPAS